MKKVIKKAITGCVVLSFVLSMFNVSFAQTTTSIWNSPACTAGTWWSGYSEDEVISLTGTNSTVYGGDVGIYFYSSSVGMPSSFNYSSSRTALIELKEDDDSSGNTNEPARKYTGYFRVDSSGLYRITSYANTYTNSNAIETNRTVELYMRIKVGVLSGDTSKNVPNGLFKYKIWVE